MILISTQVEKMILAEGIRKDVAFMFNSMTHNSAENVFEY